MCSDCHDARGEIVLLAALPCIVTAGEAAGSPASRPASEPRGQWVTGQSPVNMSADSFEEFVSGDGWTACGGKCGACGGEPELYLDSRTVLRAGWWTAAVDGSQTMIGEYQDLQPSPFWGVDQIAGLRWDRR